MSELLTGAQILCRTLVDAGVEVLFGYPGGAIMPFYDALHGHPGLRHILVRHEQAAAHAADGYARAGRDRKSTRLNSSHGYISYAVFCLKKKKRQRAARWTGSRGTRS